MNPEQEFAFVPGTSALILDLRSGVPTRRLWRGCAARSAGVDALREVVAGGEWTNRPEPSEPKRHRDGMERKAASTNFFTERTLADFLAVSDRTVRKWIRHGDLPSYKLGAARRIDPADVEDFLARHRDEAA
jgi:excisionase family DNA binding protein